MSTIEITDERKANLKQASGQLYEDAVEREAGRKFQRMSERYKDGHCERTARKLGLFSRPFDCGTVMDFGCKFGHLTPWLTEFGAGRVKNFIIRDTKLPENAEALKTFAREDTPVCE